MIFMTLLITELLCEFTYGAIGDMNAHISPFIIMQNECTHTHISNKASVIALLHHLKAGPGTAIAHSSQINADICET